MTISDFFAVAQNCFLIYFLGLYAGYAGLNLLSIITVWRYMQEVSVQALPKAYVGLEFPISILAPAYNEEATVADSIRALMQLTYSEYEIIVINDGSKDSTLKTLIETFRLTPFPEAYRPRLKTQDVRAIYASKAFPNLRVIDKANGGKADALNAGINIAKYPLFCAVDADSILDPASLERIVQPFLEDPTTVAAGGTVRIANGCRIDKGHLLSAGLPTNLLALFQVTEYLRAFLFGRLGWTPLNALLIISGAFGLFRKETVVEVGGYRTQTIGEDMELIVRLHKHFRTKRKPYRITFVPDPICWTEAPEDLKTLRNQRIRWQRGLSESLMLNIGLLFHPRGGTVGWLAMPFMLVFEWFGPIVELTGLTLMIAGYLLGYLSPAATGLFLVVAIGFGVLVSLVAVMLEEMSFHLYPKFRYVFILFFVAIIENLGYRQLNTYWRLVGLWQWSTGKKSQWGEMKRNASWKKTPVK